MSVLLGSADVMWTARLLIDLAGLAAIAGWLHRRGPGGSSAAIVLVALNLGMFAALTAISAGSFGAGAGFGLFGLLSLVRLRSDNLRQREIAYTFVCLVLALVNGLKGGDLWIPLGLSALLVATMAVVDPVGGRAEVRVSTLTLDRVVTDVTEMRAKLAQVLHAEVLDIAIDHIDLVRETTRITVSYRPSGAAPAEWLTGSDVAALR